MQFTATLLRTLKGAPLSVVIALSICQGPAGAQWLERTTGYSDKVVLSALQFLEENQFVTRNGRYGWQLAAGLQQLPLMAPELGEGAGESPSRRNSESENIRLGEIPGPLESSLDSSSLPESSKDLDLELGGEPENLRVGENLAECDRFEIREPARGRIAHEAWVTPGRIRHFCEQVRNAGQKPGLAIYRIEHPEKWPFASVSVETVRGGPNPPGPPSLTPLREREARGRGEEEEEEGVEIDEEAEGWWGEVARSLREQMPRAVFETWVDEGAAARRVGEELEVLACNYQVGEELARHVGPPGLDGLAGAVSGGRVKRVRFVTRWGA